MATYIAHYQSPKGSYDRERGLFEFESDARAGTKANAHDARMKMLELFGASAVSWTIEKVERAGAAPPRSGRRPPTASWRWISVLPNPSASESIRRDTGKRGPRRKVTARTQHNEPAHRWIEQENQ